MDNTMKNFGRNLYIALYDHKMTQKNLADKVGIPRELIGRYIKGERNPSFDTAIKIANVLGVTVDSLIK